MDVTPACLAGFNGEPFDGYESSPNGMAHAAGRLVKSSGYPAPQSCKMSRGYSLRVKWKDGERLVRFDLQFTPYLD